MLLIHCLKNIVSLTVYLYLSFFVFLVFSLDSSLSSTGHIFFSCIITSLSPTFHVFHCLHPHSVIFILSACFSLPVSLTHTHTHSQSPISFLFLSVSLCISLYFLYFLSIPLCLLLSTYFFFCVFTSLSPPFHVLHCLHPYPLILFLSSCLSLPVSLSLFVSLHLYVTQFSSLSIPPLPF